MNINHPQERIGDCVLVEPALSAYAQRYQQPVHLFVKPEYRCFFAHNESIHLVDEPFPEPDHPEPSCVVAFQWAHRHQLPFASGYFHQVGLDIRPDDRLHYRYFGEKTAEKRDIVIIAPFARSCGSQKPGGKANLMAPLEWWQEIVQKSPLPVISLGDECDPVIPGTQSLRGEPLTEVMGWLQMSRCIVSVETGLLHLAGGVGSPIVFLSSATPIWFSKPVTNCEVIRSATPNWNAELVLAGVNKACLSPVTRIF